MTHGEHTITRECPIGCLETVLSRMALNPLAQAGGARFDPPQTVGQVVHLYEERKLNQIWGLGPRRIGEIEVALVFAGLLAVDSQSAEATNSHGIEEM